MLAAAPTLDEACISSCSGMISDTGIAWQIAVLEHTPTLTTGKLARADSFTVIEITLCSAMATLIAEFSAAVERPSGRAL